MLNEVQMADRESKISGSVKSLLDTMEAMLLWSKGQMEHFKPDITGVPVTSLFEYLRNFFADTNDVRFIFYDKDDLAVQTDENYLKCIMVNLTANAVKAVRQIPQAAVTWNARKDQTNILLSISDNGVGMGDHQLKALYDATASSGAKQGLGLHIIRDLARSIGCKITLQQDSKTGTTFVLSIPK